MERMKLVVKFCGIIFLTFINHVVLGQQNNSLYFFDRVPQSIQLNPASQPSCTFYFGMPAISGIEINAGNNALGVSDILIQNNEMDMLVTPLYSKELTNQTLNKLRKNNIIFSSFNIDLASFGFRIKDSYVSFLVSDKMNMNTNIPKNLALFACEGIDVGKSLTFDNLGIKASYYREYSIGYSQKITERLSFGIRGKMLFGKANINSKQTTISLNEPDWQTLEVSSTIKVNASIPHMNVYTNEKGNVDSLTFGNFDKASDIINDLALLKKNRGLGFDLGLQFDATERLSISASIIDLGYINWKSNINSISGGGDYRFQGINLNDSADVAKTLLDTIQSAYDVTVSSDPYTTMLSPKLYLGLSYTPNRFVKFGLLSRSEYIFKTFRQQVTGSLTLYPLQMLGATFSYTLANRVYDNLGIGLVFRGGPLQMYFMSERIPIFWNKVKGNGIPFLPVYAKNINFRMGINLVFGANAQRKLKKDQPFLE